MHYAADRETAVLNCFCGTPKCRFIEGVVVNLIFWQCWLYQRCNHNYLWGGKKTNEAPPQAGTSWGESSKPDLFLNFILKVRMLRFSRHSRQKCRKSFFGHFWGLRTEDWGLKIEDWGLRTAFSPPMAGLIFILWDHKNPHELEKSSKPCLQDCTTSATLGLRTKFFLTITPFSFVLFGAKLQFWGTF